MSKNRVLSITEHTLHRKLFTLFTQTPNPHFYRVISLVFILADYTLVSITQRNTILKTKANIHHNNALTVNNKYSDSLIKNFTKTNGNHESISLCKQYEFR